MTALDRGSIEMMIVMKERSGQSELDQVLLRLEEAGARGHVSTGDVVTVIGVIGDREVIAGLPLEAFPGVDKVLPILRPYKLVGREFRNTDTVISVGPTKIGGGHFGLIAGPCSVESREQLFSAARFVKEAGATMLRGGAFKPRTSPYAFQGMGVEALEILAEARAETGLPVVTELMDVRQLDDVVAYADVIQIGARNMQNFHLLSAVGQVDKPVLLKRGLAATIEELLMAAEYIVKEGNVNVILCERGHPHLRDRHPQHSGYLRGPYHQTQLPPTDHRRPQSCHRPRRPDRAAVPRCCGRRSRRIAHRDSSYARGCPLRRRTVVEPSRFRPCSRPHPGDGGLGGQDRRLGAHGQYERHSADPAAGRARGRSHGG
jgi:3-deoxy-D-arabino-heptulosonate 7-phosphate (DAHP) synthase